MRDRSPVHGRSDLKILYRTESGQNEEKELAGPVVLRRVANTGMCLNLLSGSPKIVRAFSLPRQDLSVFSIHWLCSAKGAWKKRLSMMTAGAWSNTFDRFARGHVTDYIGFKTGSKNCPPSLTTWQISFSLPGLFSYPRCHSRTEEKNKSDENMQKPPQRYDAQLMSGITPVTVTSCRGGFTSRIFPLNTMPSIPSALPARTFSSRSSMKSIPQVSGKRLEQIAVDLRVRLCHLQRG